MKKLGKLKLNQFSKAELGRKELSNLRGGEYYSGGSCKCGCCCACACPNNTENSTDTANQTSSGTTSSTSSAK
jgi:natural product precursor